MSSPNIRLRRERLLHGWSQVYLAKQLDVSEHTLRRWERNGVIPNEYYQRRLCEIFKKSAEELGIQPAHTSLDRVEDRPEEPEEPEELGQSLEFTSLTPYYTFVGQPSEEYALQSVSRSSRLVQAPGVPHVAPDQQTPAPRQKKFLFPPPKNLPLLILLSMAVVGIVLGAFLQVYTASHASLPPVVIGHVYFLSSGQTTDDSNQGIADEIQLDIQPLSAPSMNKRYYAWLLPDKENTEGPVVLLGVLTVQNGQGHLLYSQKEHTNLLFLESRFLLTEEDAAVTPLAPSVDKNTWRALGILSQDRPNGAIYSYLDHLRHLLSFDPILITHDLKGGIAVWLYRNTQSVLEASLIEKNIWQPNHATDVNALRQQIIRVLEYLDGISSVQTDAPARTAFPILVDRRLASIGLLQLSPQQEPPGYLEHVSLHLVGLTTSVPVSDAFRKQVQYIVEVVKHVNMWLNQAHLDARQLVQMSNTQLQQMNAQSLINDMVASINNAYFGSQNPVTGQQQEGVEWVYRNIQLLAGINITAYGS